MTEPDTASTDLTNYEWELDEEQPNSVYARWGQGTEVYRALIAQFSDPYLANQAVVAQHFRLEQAREARRPPTLAQDIARVLNRHSMENASNTPDFLLAEHLERCLADVEILINRRDAWYGVRLEPGQRDDDVADASILCEACKFDGIRGDEKFCPQCGVEFVARNERHAQ